MQGKEEVTNGGKFLRERDNIGSRDPSPSIIA